MAGSHGAPRLGLQEVQAPVPASITKSISRSSRLLENTESTKRQYALQQRAIALGWSVEQIVVIGFQKLVADVGMGKAGIVLGLEVSRLARNSTELALKN
jgi:DNA invertase Pin-like site-specific DNA recombinase